MKPVRPDAMAVRANHVASCNFCRGDCHRATARNCDRQLQSWYSLNSILSAVFPARWASVIDSKKISEYSIGLVLPAR